jgi:hypothetical protein
MQLVDGSYAVEGTQVGPDGDFVSVNGTIVRAGERELQFSGEVIVQVSFTNEGQPCVCTGDIYFGRSEPAYNLRYNTQVCEAADRQSHRAENTSGIVHWTRVRPGERRKRGGGSSEPPSGERVRDGIEPPTCWDSTNRSAI